MSVYRPPRARGRVESNVASKPHLAFRAHLELLKRAGVVLWYYDEPCSLKLAEATHLRPDFLVMFSGCWSPNQPVHAPYQERELVYVEVKAMGRDGKPLTDPEQWSKLKIAAKLFPVFRFQRATFNQRLGTFTVEDIPGGTL